MHNNLQSSTPEIVQSFDAPGDLSSVPALDYLQQGNWPQPREFPHQYVAPRILQKNRSIAQRQQHVAKMSRQGMSPDQTRPLRQSLFQEQHEATSDSIRNGFMNIVNSLDTEVMLETVGTLPFKGEAPNTIMRIIQRLMPNDRGKRLLLKYPDGTHRINLGQVHADIDALERIKTEINQSGNIGREQLAFLDNLIGTLQKFTAIDGSTEALYQYNHLREAHEKKTGIGTFVRVVGFFISSGLAAFNGAIDLKNGTLSFPTMLYAGMATAAFNPHLFKGKQASEIHQVSFLQSPAYENLVHQYGLQGSRAADLADALNSGNGRSLLKRLQKGSISLEEAQDALGIRNNAEDRKLRAMSQEDLMQLAGLVQQAKTHGARQTVRQYIESGAGPESLADVQLA